MNEEYYKTVFQKICEGTSSGWLLWQPSELVLLKLKLSNSTEQLAKYEKKYLSIKKDIDIKITEQAKMQISANKIAEEIVPLQQYLRKISNKIISASASIRNYRSLLSKFDISKVESWFLAVRYLSRSISIKLDCTNDNIIAKIDSQYGDAKYDILSAKFFHYQSDSELVATLYFMLNSKSSKNNFVLPEDFRQCFNLTYM